MNTVFAGLGIAVIIGLGAAYFIGGGQNSVTPPSTDSSAASLKPDALVERSAPELTSSDEPGSTSAERASPNGITRAVLTGDGQRIAEMDMAAVLKALDTGTNRAMVMQRQLEEMKEAGAEALYQGVVADHEALVNEMRAIARRGAEIEQGEAQ